MQKKKKEETENKSVNNPLFLWQNERCRKMILKQDLDTFWVKELAHLKYLFKYYGANEFGAFGRSQREARSAYDVIVRFAWHSDPQYSCQGMSSPFNLQKCCFPLCKPYQYLQRIQQMNEKKQLWLLPPHCPFHLSACSSVLSYLDAFCWAMDWVGSIWYTNAYLQNTLQFQLWISPFIGVFYRGYCDRLTTFWSYVLNGLQNSWIPIVYFFLKLP